MVCPQHMQDHNQYGNPVSNRISSIQTGLNIFQALSHICNPFHVYGNYMIHIYTTFNSNI
ncbi:hypothetical protein Gotri_002780 [Gossypium trilobum]|uniref:Uncharacterized protein n=1 Tax=Gossypium trilobum TaxID=34281 RepID=A0A7J9F9B8_9ROSI|nr:hypothetical protein [Gossypium trilobum]